MDAQMLETIKYIRNVSKKKVTIDKIVTYFNNAGASNWEKKSVETNMKEMETEGIINENYKPLVTDFAEETQISSQIDDFTNSDTKKMIIPVTQVTPRINKETHTPIPGKAEIKSLQDYQKTILSEMKNMRSFLETVDQRVIQIENNVIGSNKSQCKFRFIRFVDFVDLLRNRISTFSPKRKKSTRKLQKRKSKYHH